MGTLLAHTLLLWGLRLSLEVPNQFRKYKGMNLMIIRREKTPIMHRIVEHNGIVHFGGVLADDLNGVSMRGQTTQICAKLDKLLADAGTDKSKLISATLFIADMKLKHEMNDVWISWLEAGDLPTRATIGVSDLGQDVLIEVVVTAAR